MRISTLAVLIVFTAPPAVRANEPVNAEFFEKKVRPILVANCVVCHGKEKQKGGLRLDSKAGFVAGGETEPLVKPSDPDRSLLVKAIRYDGDIKMPKKGKMSDADI